MLRFTRLILLISALLAILLSGCSPGATSNTELDLEELQKEDARADVMMPSADGNVVFTEKGITIDASNSDQGYVMACAEEGLKPLKIRFEANGDTYTYNLNCNDKYETYPLQIGSGTYDIKVLEQVEGSMYTPVLEQSISVELEDDLLPYLYPSQIVDYTPDSLSVKASFELSRSVPDDKKADTLYEYVTGNIAYDENKAVSVNDGYIPDPDKTLRTSKGICYDYSALLASFLRVQNIPTKIMVGYVSDNDELHAWNMVYVNGEWIWYDATKGEVKETVTDFDEEREY